REHSGAPADPRADHHLPAAVDVLVRQRHDGRDRQPDSTDPVAAPRSRRGREEAQRQDEADDRDEVGEIGRGLTNSPSGSFFGSFFLNISSIRSVTTKPPTTFAAPSITATNPTTPVSVSWCAAPATNIAPTIT